MKHVTWRNGWEMWFEDYLTTDNFPLLKAEEYSEEICECDSGLPKTNEVRRKNTLYEDDEQNWTESCCDECFSEMWNMYADQWRDYNSGRL